MIELKDVSMAYPVPKRYVDLLRHPLRPRKRILALDRVSLSIARGERVAILGPNGAGKTTLLKLIGGLLYPAAGQASVGGADTISENLQVRRQVGVVINEERSFYWRLTGRQNLAFFGVLDNLHGDRLDHKIDALLELVGLSEAADSRVAGYSSGMKQRLAIARGLLPDPQVLLLDEPTRSLDLVGSRKIRELIGERLDANRKRTIVVATNALADVMELCDRVLIVTSHRVHAERLVSEERDIQQFYETCVEAAGT